MAELYPVPAEQILIGASKFPSASQDMIGVRWTLHGGDGASRHQNAPASQDMIGQKEPKFLRQREKEVARIVVL